MAPIQNNGGCAITTETTKKPNHRNPNHQRVSKEEQFTALYQQHYDKVFRLCKGYFNGDEATANDTLQEVFIKVWQHLDLPDLRQLLPAAFAQTLR